MYARSSIVETGATHDEHACIDIDIKDSIVTAGSNGTKYCEEECERTWLLVVWEEGLLEAKRVISIALLRVASLDRAFLDAVLTRWW
jgi:hypothetical protein